jgi:squalene-hopene/tetraprenyl-beta-curcumene cyclase
VNHLLRTQEPTVCGAIRAFTAPGFPRVFYLKYHGYCGYFPLWALSSLPHVDAGRDPTH